MTRKTALKLVRSPSTGLMSMLKEAIEGRHLLNILDVAVKLNNIFAHFPDLVTKEGENSRQRVMATNIYEVVHRLYQVAQRVLTHNQSVQLNDSVPPEFKNQIHTRLLHTIARSISVIGPILDHQLSKNQKTQFGPWTKFAQVRMAGLNEELLLNICFKL